MSQSWSTRPAVQQAVEAVQQVVEAVQQVVEAVQQPVEAVQQVAEVVQRLEIRSAAGGGVAAATHQLIALCISL